MNEARKDSATRKAACLISLSEEFLPVESAGLVGVIMFHPEQRLDTLTGKEELQ